MSKKLLITAIASPILSLFILAGSFLVPVSAVQPATVETKEQAPVIMPQYDTVPSRELSISDNAPEQTVVVTQPTQRPELTWEKIYLQVITTEVPQELLMIRPQIAWAILHNYQNDETFGQEDVDACIEYYSTHLMDRFKLLEADSCGQ